MEFKARLAQYYKKNPELMDEFNAMWEFMMDCYLCINKITVSKNEQDLIRHLKSYNRFADFLFDMMLNYEQKLIASDITI